MEHKQDCKHKEVKAGGNLSNIETTEEEVTFFHDFVAGGVAGSASVIVGHPFDTIKVRMQTSLGGGMRGSASSYGGILSLYRGLAAPLSTACVINALIFSSYGWSSRVYDQVVGLPPDNAADAHPLHDPFKKAFTCGSFAGLVQALVVCPMEHVKCRLQVQHAKGSPDHLHKGPVQAARSILRSHGMPGLFRGWSVTMWREVPAFGAYFALYDLMKDNLNSFFAQRAGPNNKDSGYYAWAASALAGGITGASTWLMIYPFDVIKTKIQTLPIDTPLEKRRILTVGSEIVQKHGISALFRGLNITVFRAFPVNAIIFPVYEFTLLQIASLEYTTPIL
eukprot:Nitzschia sp. Nitz4//scaffold264_size26629//24865//25954//NITZ4_008241-RA/size26629-augustus-gene-0.3-mRNA-1//1//CDS//3329544818//2677//frame0